MLAELKAAMVGLAGNGVPVTSKTRRNTEDVHRATSALATLTMQLRRQRFSIASFIPMLILSGLAIWAVIRFWPRNDYQPTQGALQWYEIGTDALRDGAYHRASKALQQAIAIDGVDRTRLHRQCERRVARDSGIDQRRGDLRKRFALPRRHQGHGDARFS
jgi:hypothetical protein